MEIYNIDPEQLNKFMMKKALKDAGLLGLIAIIFLIILAFATDIRIIFFLITKVGPYLLLATIGVFFISLISSNIPDKTRYVVADNFFGRFLLHDELNAFAQHSLNKLERRSGQKQQEKIYFNETKSIKITESKIIITGDNYNFFNGNGRIVIPCEVAEFDQLKSNIKNICRGNRNIDRQFEY